MMIRPDCGTASANPNPIALPGCSTVCVVVLCVGDTDLEARYTLTGTVTFDDGSKAAGPFPVHCAGGACNVCRLLCFKGGGVQSFPVDICVKDTASGIEMCCTVNIQVR